jgi:hypothetical protein
MKASIIRLYTLNERVDYLLEQRELAVLDSQIAWYNFQLSNIYWVMQGLDDT